MTRRFGIMMPHYANRVAKATDESGIGLLKELAVVSELKVAATVQNGLSAGSLRRNVDKLTLLLEEHELSNQGPAPLAYFCVLDNHAKRPHTADALEEYIASGHAHPGMKLLFPRMSGRRFPLTGAWSADRRDSMWLPRTGEMA